MPAGSAPAAADCPGGALGAAEFAGLMAPLGPFGPAPRIAAGVSGGPHSLALALLAADWAAARGGDLLALVVDHGLRPASGAEAAGVVAQLAARGIAARLLPLGLAAGPAMQERARDGRRAALLGACRQAGRPWLLLGHHRGDQAETLLFRALRGSGATGLAAMAPARAEAAALVLRPLLGIAPARLEATVAAAGLTPLRDPSNHDPRFARTRLRGTLADSPGEGLATAALAEAAGAFAARRARRDQAVAARLAAAARLWPEGWAELDGAALGTDAVADQALATLLHRVGGGAVPPPLAAVAALRRRGAGTLGGAWLLARQRGWRLLREPALVAPPVPALAGAHWDRRFRLTGEGEAGCLLGALGAAGAAARRLPGVPAAVCASLPAIWRNGTLVAVPGLDYRGAQSAARFATVFAPGG